MRLFEINAEIEFLLAQAIDPDTGEVLDDDLDCQLDNLQMDREEKALDLACMVKQLNADLPGLAEVIAGLQKRKAAKIRAIERITEYLRSNLPKGSRIEDSRATISWRKTTKVIIDDEGKIPRACMKEPKLEPSRTYIKDMIESGESVPGAHLQKTTLSIK